jgi:alginate O-acetyltransferase complex protein AlgI
VIFVSYWFFAFALLVLPGYWVLWKPLPRKIWLALACVVFHYHFAGPAGVLPIILLGLMTFLCGWSGSRKACTIAIAVNVAALCLYKYTQFLTLHAVALLNPSWGQWLWDHAQGILPAAAPLAISFFAFEFVHYLYDVAHGAEPIANPLNFLLFAIFFPSLVAGPIKRFENFLPSLKAGLETHSGQRIMRGGLRIGVGMFKKLVLADNLTAWINFSVPRFQSLDRPTRWLVFLAIGMRILMDFSGYSDIALGLAEAMGITIPENFNWPYFATNIQDFWRRWHISLSTWIRDYVYIPMGGGAHGKARTVLNGLFAFSLVGLWHGAQWYYVFWGVYHGVGLMIHRLYKEFAWKPFEAAYPDTAGRAWLRWPVGAFSWLLTQTFVFVGWMFFFYPVKDALHYMYLMFHA